MHNFECIYFIGLVINYPIYLFFYLSSFFREKYLRMRND